MGGWSERVMGQTGFFDVERRLEAISALGDPLVTASDELDNLGLEGAHRAVDHGGVDVPNDALYLHG